MMHLEYDAVIFDLDGVLVDSTVVIERHWKRWAEKHGIELERVLEVAHGRRTADTISLLAPHVDAKSEAEAFAADEARDNEGLVEIYGAKDLIAMLNDSKWAVATSGSKNLAIARLRFVGVPVPSVLVTADDVERGKPDSQAYLLAQSRLNVDAKNCVVVEDAPAGIEAARQAGMSVVAVATTHIVEELKAADVIVQQLSDIRAQQVENRNTLFITES